MPKSDIEGQKEPRLIEEGQEQNRALFAVFERMVPFVLQATTVRRREKYRIQLCEALEDYLDLRKLLPACYLELRDEGEKALCFGEPLEPALTGVAYRALARLIAAYPSERRVLSTELNDAANSQDARASLRDLCEKYPVWEKIIDFPEKKGHGYALKRLSSPPPASPQSPATPPI